MRLLPLEDFVIPMSCSTSKDTAHTDVKMTLSFFFNSQYPDLYAETLVRTGTQMTLVTNFFNLKF